MWQVKKRSLDLAVKVDKRTALIVVDVQNDFCGGGALPVPDGDAVVPVLNSYIAIFVAVGAPVFMTRDWHPADHSSFAAQGGPWPPHCVQNTGGAAFHPKLAMPEGARVVSAGYLPEAEGYSGFEGTDLAEQLRALSVRRLLVGGLATDYCVKSTVIEALSKGFEVHVLVDAVRGVEVQPGDSRRAMEEMRSHGARELELRDLLP
jgi:nicotinamidase/pyrazinamidase